MLEDSSKVYRGFLAIISPTSHRFPLTPIAPLLHNSGIHFAVTALLLLMCSESALAANEFGHIASDLDYFPRSNWLDAILGLVLIVGGFIWWLCSLSTKKSCFQFIVVTGGISGLLFLYGNNSAGFSGGVIFCVLTLLGVYVFLKWPP